MRPMYQPIPSTSARSPSRCQGRRPPSPRSGGPLRAELSSPILRSFAVSPTTARSLDTNCIVPLYTKRIRTQGKRICRVPAGPETWIYVYDEDKPSVQPQPHGALLAQQRAGRLCVDPGRGLRLGVPGESTDHAQVTSRVVAELAEMGSSTGPMRSGPSPSRQRQLDLRSQPGRRDLDLRRGLLVGRTRSTSI